MPALILAAVFFLATATAPAPTRPPEPPRAKPLLPQVWIDAETNVFHSFACPKITKDMTSRARTIAKAQGIAPSPECAISDAEALKRWRAELKKGDPPGSKPAGGFATIGNAPLAPLPTVDNAGGARGAARRSREPRSTSSIPSPTASRTEVMNASDFYDAERLIASTCSARWRTDAEMQAYCVEQQRAAVRALKQGRPFGADENAWGLARVRCAQRYPTDYEMRLYCEGNP